MHSSPRCILRLPNDINFTILLFGRLAGHKQPPDGDQQSDTSTNAESACRAYGIDDRTRDKSANKKGCDSDDFVVARDDHALEMEELRVRHELTPNGGQHNCYL